MGKIIIPSKSIFPKDNLLALWTFNDSTLESSVGNYFAFINNGPAFFVDGIINQGISLSPEVRMRVSNNLWDVTTNPLSYSISFWVRKNAINDTGQQSVFLGSFFGDMGFVFLNQFLDGTNLNNAFSFVLATGANYEYKAVEIQQSMDIGVWYHIVGTYNLSSQTAKLYINGSLAGTTTEVLNNAVTNSGWTGFAVNGSAVFDVGDEYGNDYSFDELGFWTKTLSDEEVARLYNNGNGLKYILNNKISIKKQNTNNGKLIVSSSNSCGYRNLNKLIQVSGTSPLGATFNNISFNYASFASNCSTLGLDPTTILNSLGAVNFNDNYIVMRARTGSGSLNADNIYEIEEGIINITNVGPFFGVFANHYRFFVMCKKGWNTVRFYGVDYAI